MNSKTATTGRFQWTAIGVLLVGISAATITGVSSTEPNDGRGRTPADPVSQRTLHRDVATMPTFPDAAQVDLRTVRRTGDLQQSVQLCQFCGPTICGVDCADCPCGPGEPRWTDWRPIPWQVFAQGEYAGPHRTAHVPEYRLRVDDNLEFVYLFSHEESSEPYRFGVGDELIIESLTDETLNRGDLNLGRGLEIQPDGTVTLRLLGQIPVASRTVDEIREDLENRYTRYYQVPAITVTPLKTKTKLEDLRDTIDARQGFGGQVRAARVTPSGTVQLPGISDVPAQGLTVMELEREIEERYLERVGQGVQVTPVLVTRAPRFIYVLGEVATPGRFTLEGPTTAMQAIALAGGWNNGGNLREIVVFRRAEDWRLMATKLDLNGALFARRPCPADEIWLRDSDIVVVPQSPILAATEFIDLVFTRGIYGVLPFQGVSFNISTLSSL